MNRREFVALGGAAIIGSGTNASSQARDSSKLTTTPASVPQRYGGNQPNILLLMADQLRMDCVGAYGNSAIRTPNMDRLAKEGVRFQCAYSTTPTCVPARTALLTGLGPWRHGKLGMGSWPMASNPYPVEKARAMSQAGYYTTSIGKNHYNPWRNAHGYHQMVTDEHCTYWFHRTEPRAEASPEDRCDYESWFWSQMPDKDPHATGMGWNDYIGNPFVYPEEFHATHWTGDTAVHFLEQYDRSQPFFLKVSFIRPHSPYDPPERFFKMYEDVALPNPKAGTWAKRYEPRNSSREDIWRGKLLPEVVRRSRQSYYGNVSFVDEQVGRILEVLEKRQMLEETLILLISDHGDMLGDQNLWRKSYGYEQSAHVPMLMRPPSGMGLGPAGQVFANPVELRDVVPTLLDAAGVSIPDSIEGKSLLHLIRTKGEGWRPYIDLEHDVGFLSAWNGFSDGRWKYLYYAKDGEEQLFHLESDPNELENLAGIPEYTKELQHWRGLMVDHLAERGPKWVSNGKLATRVESIPFSPNFPGYAPLRDGLVAEIQFLASNPNGVPRR
jgi:arylsulfatase